MVPETRAPHNKGTFTGSLSRAAPGSVNVLCQASLQTYFSKCKSAVKVIEGPKEPGEIKSQIHLLGNMFENNPTNGNKGLRRFISGQMAKLRPFVLTHWLSAASILLQFSKGTGVSSEQNGVLGAVVFMVPWCRAPNGEG